MINGYGLHGHCEDALSLYSEMRLLGLKPDRITYVSVLSACCHAGSVEQGRMVLGSMIHDRVMPVDLLGRAGHLEEAYEIVKTMGHQDCCGSLLASLLGACLSHGNYELGEEVGRFLLDMSPEDCGPYVIVSMQLRGSEQTLTMRGCCWNRTSSVKLLASVWCVRI